MCLDEECMHEAESSHKVVFRGLGRDKESAGARVITNISDALSFGVYLHVSRLLTKRNGIHFFTLSSFAAACDAVVPDLSIHFDGDNIIGTNRTPSK